MTINRYDKYQPVIGLEVHVQLLTKSKIFASDSTNYGSAPNSQVSVITLAHPGTLPKLNRVVIEMAIKMGLACHCEISQHQIFDRKNYFYPDLPKGYQITQDRTPACRGGHIKIRTSSGTREIRLNRIHIEEDAGKSFHVEGEDYSLIDLNRAGVPLIEIVTEPVIYSAEEAGALMTEIRKLVRYLGICDGNMEEGSLRCDANVSVMLRGSQTLGKKVEVKNMNSIRYLQRAIEYEIDRQIKELESGGSVVSETRTFDVHSGTTRSMRTKEELNDYRYFPDPDLSPLDVSDEWLQKIKDSMPALPEELLSKLINEYNLPEYDAIVLTESTELAHYFMRTCEWQPNYKGVSNWIMGPVKSHLNEKGISISEFAIVPKKLAELITLVDESKVSYSIASQRLLAEMLKQPDQSPLNIATSLNLIQDNNDDRILKIVEEVLRSNPVKVTEYKKGKKGLISMFMGEVMKKTNGKADPRKTNTLLLKMLKEQ